MIEWDNSEIHAKRWLPHPPRPPLNSLTAAPYSPTATPHSPGRPSLSPSLPLPHPLSPSLPLPPFTPFLPAPPAAHYSCLAPKIFTSTPIFANNLAISVKKNYLSHTHTWGRNSGPYIVTILSSIPPPGRHLLLPPLYPAAPHSPPSLPPAT